MKRPISRFACLTASAVLLMAFSPLGSPRGDEKAADDAKAKGPKVTYQEALAVFQSRCLTCHNGDKQKGGLVLDNYAGAMQGGGSGKVIEPGSPDESTLFLVVNHQEEPKMPPNSPKIPDNELAIIRQWIEGGAVEKPGDIAGAPKKPKFEFKLDPSMVGKPQGPPAVPEGVATEPAVVTPRPNAILALAHSPWAPVAAVGAHKQVLLYRTDGTRRLVGVFPFPEGTVHTLKFSRNGELLLAAGGRGANLGIAVVYNVKTGQRVFEIGKEYDIVLAADISPDQSMVALGGPARTVRVYNTADGSLLYELKKHTEWITAVEFSPDGVLLATADRNQGLIVWESLTGREFFDLRGHGASLTDVSWRADANVLASASEDGTVKLWEMNNGTQIKSFDAHGGGAKSVRFTLDGRLVTSGRDRVVRLWDANGGKVRDFEPFNDIALQAAFNQDATAIVGGDFTGEVRVWDLNSGARLANLVANPAPVAQRLEAALAQSKAARESAEAQRPEIEPLQKAAQAAAVAFEPVQQAFAKAQADLTQVQAKATEAQKAVEQSTAAANAVAGQHKAAQDALAKMVADKATHEKALNDATAAEKPATDALEAAKAGVDQAIAAKTTADQAVADLAKKLREAASAAEAATLTTQLNAATLAAVDGNVKLTQVAKARIDTHAKVEAVAAAKTQAQTALAALPPQIEKATADVKAQETALAQANAAKDQAAKAHAEVTAQVQTATNVMNTAKAQHDPLAAAKAQADKALADKTAAVNALATQADGLKVDADALAAELKAKAPPAAAALATPPAPPQGS